MFRTTDMVLIAVMVSAAAFTYKTKGEAEDQLAAARKLERQIRLEEDTIDLLKADWSLLTQPVRLQKLTEVYQAELNLQAVEAQQIVEPDDIPARPIPDPAKEPQGIASSGQDKTVTGSTKP